MNKFDQFLKNFLRESPVPAPTPAATPTNTNLDFSKLTPQQQTAVKTALTTNKPLMEIDPKHPLLTQLVQQQPATQNKTPATPASPSNNTTTPSTNAANKQTI